MISELLGFVWFHPLNRANRFAALSRVLRWQIASRLMPGLIALPFVEDRFLFARRGLTGVTGNYYCGLHELNEMAFVLHVLRPGDIFVDVGANVGGYTVLASATGSDIVSIEPIPTTFRHLSSNVALNGLHDRVSLHNIGLSDEVGVLRFSAGLDTVNHVLAVDEELPSVEVRVTRLDDLLANSRAPELIKLDVEGHELAVLKGADRVLGNSKLLAVIMETNGSGARYGLDDKMLFELMEYHDFRPFNYDPFERQLTPFIEGGLNAIFIRDLASVKARVASARQFRLINGVV